MLYIIVKEIQSQPVLISIWVTKWLREYKYLGVILHEHVDFGVTAEVLAGAGGRALGSILHKYKQNEGSWILHLF